MLILLFAACIENSFDAPPGDEEGRADTDAADTDATDTDTDTVDTGADDTAAPVDTDTGAPDDTGVPDDTDDTAVDTDLDTGTGDTDLDTDIDTDVDTGPSGPVVVAGVCADAWTGWSDDAAVEPELHVVGMYESQYGDAGPAYVSVTRTAEMVLALTSLEAVAWEVDLAPGTDVTEIVVSYGETGPESTVTFVSGTTAPVTDARWIGACAYEYPDDDPTSGCETPDLEAILEARTGRAMSSFQGCYSGGEFAVE